MVKTLPSKEGGVDSIPGWGMMIPHAEPVQPPQKKNIYKIKK